MKRFNNFLDHGNLFLVFLTFWSGCGIFFSFFFYLLSFTGTSEIEITTILSVQVGVSLGLLASLILTFAIHATRKSQKFWEYKKIVDNLVEEASTKSQLESIFNNEMLELQKLSMGGPHTIELTRLVTIIRTKYKYI